VLDRRGVAGPASATGAELAPAAGGARESVGRAAPAVRVDPRLLLRLLAHLLGGLGARGRYESLAGVAGVGADPAASALASATIVPACSCAARMTSTAAALGAMVEHLRSLRVGIRTDRGRLLVRLGQGPFDRPACRRRPGAGRPRASPRASSCAPSITRAMSASLPATARSRACSCVRSCVNAWPASVLVN
jgi:hypothetical protein